MCFVIFEMYTVTFDQINVSIHINNSNNNYF